MASQRSTSRISCAIALVLGLVVTAACTSSGTENEAAPTLTTTTTATTTVVVPPQAIQDQVAEYAGCLDTVVALAEEEWSYCQATTDLELFHIDWVIDDVEYTERFALVDGSLAYALEATGSVDGGTEIAPWAVEYVIDDDVVVDHWSIGLGPTESDDWDPAAIVDRWSDRRATALEIRSAN